MIYDKNELRKTLLKKRSELNDDVCRKLSKTICKKLTALDLYKEADTVFAYSSIRNEVSCEYIIDKAKADGKKIALPRVISSADDNEMQFFYIGDSELESGYMGICEPDEDYANIAVPSGKTLIILPGIAFGKNFGRIGYGKGFYDRYLEMYGENALSIAVCYDFQLLDEVPAEDNDIPADAIITPTAVLIKGDKI